jgi:hypothetical protein
MNLDKALVGMLVFGFIMAVFWVFVLLHLSCAPKNQSETILDFDDSDTVDLHEYPAGPYGYRSGYTWPLVDLQDRDQRVVTSQTIYDMLVDVHILVLSIEDCPSCPIAYEHSTDLQKALDGATYSTDVHTIVGGADTTFVKNLSDQYPGIFWADLEKKVTGAWEADKVSPEDLRGYPSVVYLDSDMGVVYQTLGFANDPDWYAEQVRMIDDLL